MKDFDEIIGHEKIKEHLQSAIKLDKISHAYIFNGPQGSGKKMLADVFAKTLQCEANGEKPCNECHSCIQAESGNHPDIIHISHKKPNSMGDDDVSHKKSNSIGIDDVREQFVGDMQIRPYSSRYKIYIMDEADKMTQQAQNAILKTIEEPPSYGIVILLTENADGMLSTILSRCVRLELNPIEDSKLTKYLIEKYQVSQNDARFATAFAQGCVGRAEAIINSEAFNKMKDQAFHILKYSSEMTIGELVAAVKATQRYKDEINDFMDLLAMWYRDVLLFKSTNDVNLLMFKEEVNMIKSQASTSSYEGIEKILKALDTAKKRLRANVNFDLTIELLFLTIREN